MMRTPINAPDGPTASGGYSQAVLLEGVCDMLIVSGQIPVDGQSEVPAGFDAQCALVWRNVDAQLRAGGMDKSDIVKVTTYLSDRKFAQRNSEIRQAFLGDLAPALTIVIAGIYDPEWLLEIEAWAARH